MESKESQPGRIDIPSHMVCQSRQRKGDGHLPAHLKGQQDYLWKWRIPIIAELDQILLVRDVILTAEGKLSPGSLSVAAGLQFPHHLGAGGE